ncbi:hypothetical protein Avbf_09253 [Armadillidium vulgare]|nr:hypothetical protein Avbf_09253 [Armadillidium vulgare]
MIIVSKTLEESSKLYENVFAMQERLMNIRVCCQKPIEDFLESCQICGSTNEEEFLSPLSCKNNMGDTALTCAMKMEHSEMIINYLLSGISRNENDVRKVFDKESIEFFQEQVRYYPSLLRFIKPENETKFN